MNLLKDGYGLGALLCTQALQSKPKLYILNMPNKKQLG